MKQEIVNYICDFIKSEFNDTNCVNAVIREDVFSLLESKCVVLYYPLEDHIDGCHKTKVVNNDIKQFVFINTLKDTEEQVWTAAHELGHVIKVDQEVKTHFQDYTLNKEEVVGRFSAELLMPSEIFNDIIRKKLEEYRYTGHLMSIQMILDLTVYLMNFFCVPYESVLKRYTELDHTPSETIDKMKEYDHSDRIKKIIRENQYTRIYTNNNHSKSIDDIQYKLLNVEKNKLMNESKVKIIRKTFDLDSTNIEGDLEFDINNGR